MHISLDWGGKVPQHQNEAERQWWHPSSIKWDFSSSPAVHLLNSLLSLQVKAHFDNNGSPPLFCQFVKGSRVQTKLHMNFLCLSFLLFSFQRYIRRVEICRDWHDWPAVKIFPENNTISGIICAELQDLHTIKPLAMRRWTAAPPFSNVTFCPIWCLWINLKGLNKCLLAKKPFWSIKAQWQAIKFFF